MWFISKTHVSLHVCNMHMLLIIIIEKPVPVSCYVAWLPLPSLVWCYFAHGVGDTICMVLWVSGWSWQKLFYFFFIPIFVYFIYFLGKIHWAFDFTNFISAWCLCVLHDLLCLPPMFSVIILPIFTIVWNLPYTICLPINNTCKTDLLTDLYLNKLHLPDWV